MKHIDPRSLQIALGLPGGKVIPGRHRTLDMLTFDHQGGYRTIDNKGTMYGQPLGGTFRTWDGTRTVDSTGAFLVGELERLDQTLHAPLAAVSWGRDIDLREDVTIADEASSFTLSTFASAGGLGTGNGIGNGKAWIGKDTNQIGGVGLDIAKVPHRLAPWALEIKYTILELESAAKLGRPVDQQKFDGLKLKHQMDIDEQVYFGDVDGTAGLTNSPDVANVSNVANGAGGSPLWSTKTPAEILQDVNELLTSVWTASAYAVMPSRLLLPPDQFGYISTQFVSAAGDKSILTYLMENNIATTSTGAKLVIYPLKWLVGAGAGGTLGTQDGHNRMVAYTKERDRVRYPMTLLQRTPVQYDSIYHKSTYFCRLGVVEVVYPETIGYRDGIG